jgi:hypothetical protein
MASTFDPSSSALDSNFISIVAEKVTEEYYSKDVGALTRWGAEGRKRTLEDTIFTLQHLSSAVFVNDLNLFLDYIKWLVVVLTSRRVTIDVIILHTGILIDVLKQEKIKASEKNEKSTLKKCINYLNKVQSVLTQIKEDPKTIEGFRYLK